MAAYSTPVTVRVADALPVAGFIAQVAHAESLLRSMTKEQVCALPAQAVTAMCEIQGALRDLGIGLKESAGEPAEADGS